jgi:hypothetical protein
MPRVRRRRRRRHVGLVRWFAPLATVALAAGVGRGGTDGLVAALVGMFVLLACCRDRDGSLRLLGPFVGMEIKRSARGSRRHFWRPVYVGATLLGFLWSFADALPRAYVEGRTFAQVYLTFQAANEWFFVLYALATFGYVMALTVNVLSATISEERDGRRWDVLRSTDLTTREILVGKSVGRLPQLLDPFLATLPVIALSTLLGGVSPRMVLFLACGILAGVVLVGGLTLLTATVSRTSAQIRVRVVVALVLYLLVATLPAVDLTRGGVEMYVARATAKNAPAAPIVTQWLRAGNPFFPYVEARRAGLGLEDGLAFVVRRFAAFATLVGVGSTLIAVARFRGAPRPIRLRPSRHPIRPDPTVPTRPRLREFPVYWWERFGTLAPWQHAFGAAVTRGFVLRFFACLVLLLAFVRVAFLYRNPDGVAYGKILIGAALFVISAVMIAGTLFRGARCLSGERAAGTLDPLLATPLGTNDILIQKWRALYTRQTPLGLLGAALLVAGTVTGFVHPAGAVFFGAGVAFHTMAAAAVGLCFGVGAATPEAAVRTLLLVLAPCCVVFTVAALPPVASAGFLFVGEVSVATENTMVAFGLGSMTLWGVAWAIAWAVARSRFRKVATA